MATTGAHLATFGGGDWDAFLVKFNSSGVRQWGTYYGGTAGEAAYHCATDASGNVYLTGEAKSTTGVATTGAHQTAIGRLEDAFLVKFNSSGVRQWGTYYGGSGNDYGHSCATDASGNVYLAGDARNSTTGIATTGAHQTTRGGVRDAFLVKFNSSGVRQWGTFYGGTGDDKGRSCATDTSGNIYLAGQTRSNSGIATTGAHQTTSGGSDDAFLVKFDACPAVYSQDTITACDSYTWIDGVIYTLSDTTAMDTLVNAAGCDSIVSLFLTINNSTSAIDTITACDSYTWIDGVTYSSSNTTAKDTLVNAAGCDSIVSLFLTINNSTSAIDTITACDSYTWIDGVTYTLSDTTAKDTLVNAAGCDSIVSLFLTINNSTSAIDTITACDSYTWIDGVTYYDDNTTAKDTLLNAAGCDSIVSLFLTINNSTSAIDTITACDSYTWIDGVTYTSSDTSAKHTLVNVLGCDSVVSLKLTINTIDKSVNTSRDTLNAVESGAQYQWLDCEDSYGIIVSETGQSFIASSNGSYAVEITKNGCADTTTCYDINTVGLGNSFVLSKIKVYPNPTSGNLTIDAENYKGVEVYDTSGRLIIKSALNTIDLEEQSKGLYLLKVNANGTTQEFRVFKE